LPRWGDEERAAKKGLEGAHFASKRFDSGVSATRNSTRFESLLIGALPQGRALFLFGRQSEDNLVTDKFAEKATPHKPEQKSRARRPSAA
jgi:hypothetical protein